MQSSVHYTKRAKNILHIAYHSEYHETSFCSLNGMSPKRNAQHKRINDMRFDADAQFINTNGIEILLFNKIKTTMLTLQDTLFETELFGSLMVTPSNA